MVAAVAARLACDSTPSDAHTLWIAIGVASERASAAAAWAVYSSIITPESGPGSFARNGSRPLIRGSRIALTRPAISDAECANAARSPSSAAPSSAAWKLPVGSARPSSISAFSGRALSSRASTSASVRSASWATPSTCGSTRNGYGSWTSRSGAWGSNGAPASSSRIRCGHRRLTAGAAARLDASVEHDRIGVERLERQRRDLEPALVQRPRVDAEQRGMAGGDGVRADEAERVAQAEPDRLRRRRRVDERAVAPHLSLAEQRQRDLGQAGKVAGAERAERARERRDVRVQRGDERVEQRRRDPGPAGAELVGARNHARPLRARCSAGGRRSRRGCGAGSTGSARDRRRRSPGRGERRRRWWRRTAPRPARAAPRSTGGPPRCARVPRGRARPGSCGGRPPQPPPA